MRDIFIKNLNKRRIVSTFNRDHKRSRISFTDLLLMDSLKLSTFLFFLAALYALFLIDALEDDPTVKIINTLGPILLVVYFYTVGYRTVRLFPTSILTPYVAFISGCALFYGIGPLVYIFGSEDTLSYIHASKTSITNIELVKVNLLVTLGLLATFFGVYISTRILINRYPSINYNYAFQLPTLAVAFTTIGFITRYFLSLPYEFGILGFTLPGIIHSLSNLLALGNALIGFLSVRSGRIWKLLFWIILLPNVLIAVLQFSKSAAIINLFLPAIGCFMAHRRFSNLFRWLFVAVIMYFMMQPMVLTARSHIYGHTGTIYRATLSERLHIVKRYVKGELSFGSNRGSKYQPGWTRLNYSGELAYAMRLYDKGTPSKTLHHLWYVFIPRVIWPSKPIGIGPGENFNEIVTGRRGSFRGLGIYGDGYWNAGWPGVIGFGILMGTIFGWTSQTISSWLLSGQFVYLPAIFIAFKMALLGPNKYLINGLIAPFVVFISYIAFITIISRFKISSDIETRKKLNSLI